MNNVITAVYNLLKNDSRLQDNQGSNTKINVFEQFDQSLFIDFPVLFLERLTMTPGPVVRMGNSYDFNYALNIFVIAENMVNYSDRAVSLDLITENITTILLENPKLDGTFYDSNIGTIAYGEVSIANRGFESILIPLTVTRRVDIGC